MRQSTRQRCCCCHFASCALLKVVVFFSRFTSPNLHFVRLRTIAHVCGDGQRNNTDNNENDENRYANTSIDADSVAIRHRCCAFILKSREFLAIRKYQKRPTGVDHLVPAQSLPWQALLPVQPPVGSRSAPVDRCYLSSGVCYAVCPS